MSKKLYLLLIISIFSINLNLKSMAPDDVVPDEPTYEPEEEDKEFVYNVARSKRKFHTASLLRVEMPAGFSQRRFGSSPEQLMIIDPDGKNTGIYVDIPEININLHVPPEAEVTPISRPGLEGSRIHLPDGKAVNMLFPNLNTLP